MAGLFTLIRTGESCPFNTINLLLPESTAGFPIKKGNPLSDCNPGTGSVSDFKTSSWELHALDISTGSYSFTLKFSLSIANKARLRCKLYHKFVSESIVNCH